LKIEGDILTQRFAILGGTFDPIHIGHLAMAEQIKDEIGAEKVLFLPSGNPPHKDLDVVTEAKHRAKMVELSIESNLDFLYEDLEMKRSGWTYTVDTLHQLKQKYDDVKFFYIIGADVVFDLLTWKRFEEVFSLTHFIVVQRTGYSKDFPEKMDRLRKIYHANIQVSKVPLMDVSSSYIRKRAQDGLSIKYLVHDSVEKYIVESQVYRKEE
jgi:nicotinate-nucleotide adenylyltransferase